MNRVTGLFENEPGYTPDNPATEIYHTRLPSNDPYGQPRWISQVPNLIGSRESEECNMRFFEDNTIPPAMLTVAGGRLTNASYQELTKVISTGVGKERQNKMIVVEAVGEGDSLDGTASALQIKVEKLSSERPSDGLFKSYDEGNQTKLRSAFRLPPIVVGMSQDATFATANVSQFVAETQVFAPARQRNDESLNNLLINGRAGLRLGTVKLVARTPSISSPEAMMKALTALNVIGAVTPRSAQVIANSMLQIELPPYPEKGQDGYEAWMDQPLPLTVKDAVQATHNEQAAKDAAIKATEGNGDVAPSTPKHGQE
jgi:capsid portal protein